MSFTKIYEEKKAAFEAELSEIFDETSAEIPEPLKGAVEYGLLGGGKRLRPILLLESFRMFGGEPTTAAIKFAAAIECIHAYSLIHDDLPSMDNDELRRGKPTVHKAFGEGIAVLAGDALLNLAYEWMSGVCLSDPGNPLFIRAMAFIAVSAGARGLIAGQTVDLTAGGDLSVDDLKYIYRHKTGDLIIAAAAAGALLGGANADEIGCVKRFAEHFAYAFQIKDDLLDYEEKPDKEDVSFVKFYGRSRSSQTLGDTTQKAQKELAELKGRDIEFLKQTAIKFATRKE